MAERATTQPLDRHHYFPPCLSQYSYHHHHQQQQQQPHQPLPPDTGWKRTGAGRKENPCLYEADLALYHIHKGRARGSVCTLSFRACYQRHLRRLGDFVQLHAWKVLVVGILALTLCCLGLKSVQLETRMEKLWMPDDPQVKRHMRATKNALGEKISLGYSEMILHTLDMEDSRSSSKEAGILTPASLLRHLHAIHSIMRKVYVNGPDEVRYDYEKLCVRPSLPRMPQHTISTQLKTMIPCQLITPLDCFWEGAKLLGPSHSLQIKSRKYVSWRNFNPLAQIRRYQRRFPNEDFRPILNLFRETGVSSGYLRKPCLQPNDTECPPRAPNRLSGEEPNVPLTLQGGCRGFAAKVMQWRREILVGGTRTSTSKTIDGKPALVAGAALMSKLFLKSARDVHDEIQRNAPYIDWSIEQSEDLIKRWLRLLRNEVIKLDTDSQISSGERFLTVNEVALDDQSSSSSYPSWTLLAVPPCLLTAYLMLSLAAWRRCLQSCDFRNSHSDAGQVWLVLAGMLLLLLASAAGLGVAAVLRLPFNLFTLQLLPGLLLGLATAELFSLMMAFNQNARGHKSAVGITLQEQGLPILHGNCGLIAVFVVGSFSPLPAVHMFCLQASLVVAFQLLMTLLLFPALLAVDLLRQSNSRINCCSWLVVNDLANDVLDQSVGHCSQYQQSLAPSIPPPPSVVQNTEARLVPTEMESISLESTLSITRSCSSESGTFLLPTVREEPFCSQSSLSTRSATDVRPTPVNVCKLQVWRLLCSRALHVLIIALISASLGLAIYGATLLELGLEWDLVVPRKSLVSTAMLAQRRYFGLQSVDLITGDKDSSFNYAEDQHLLRQFHRALEQVPGLLPSTLANARRVFWLDAFRDWLLEQQTAFDQDVQRGTIGTNMTWTKKATERGLVGMRLLLQTGRAMEPLIDRRRLLTGRLVDSSGRIYPQAFYNYLRAWYNLDQIGFRQLNTLFQPYPTEFTLRLHSRTDFLIPACDPLSLTLTTLIFEGVNDSDSGLHLLSNMRRISTQFEARGLPNYPSGFLFKFLGHLAAGGVLSQRLIGLIACGVGGLLILSFVLLAGGPVAALISWLSAPMVALQVAGVQGLLQWRLNSASIIVMLLSAAVAARFTGKLLFAYVGLLQHNKKRRVHRSLSLTAPQICHGFALSVLGVCVLFCASYDFISLYFLKLFVIGLVFALVDSLVVLPALLALCGPPSQVQLIHVSCTEEGGLPPSTPPVLPLAQPAPQLNYIQQYPSHLQVPSHQNHFSDMTAASVGVPSSMTHFLQRSMLYPSTSAQVVTLPPSIHSDYARLSTISEEPSDLSSQSSVNSVLHLEPDVLLNHPAAMSTTASTFSSSHHQHPPAAFGSTTKKTPLRLEVFQRPPQAYPLSSRSKPSLQLANDGSSTSN